MDSESQQCPYCGGRLVRWANPDGTSWDAEFQLVCFNDECSYYVRGWEWMNNDVVNFLSSIFGALVSVGFYFLVV